MIIHTLYIIRGVHQAEASSWLMIIDDWWWVISPCWCQCISRAKRHTLDENQCAMGRAAKVQSFLNLQWRISPNSYLTISRNWIFTESFSVLCLVDIKKNRNFAAYFYVDTIKYSVKQWFLNEKHIWITLWDAREMGW